MITNHEKKDIVRGGAGGEAKNEAKEILNSFVSVGSKAPDFTLLNQDGREINLYSTLATGKSVLLVFYPKDNTPGCTNQLCSLRDDYEDLKKNGIVIYGVNHGTAKSHRDFINKQGYQFDILVDEGKKVIHQYGATKMFFKNVTVSRSVVLIDSNGTIKYVFKGQQDNKKVLDAHS